MSVNEINIIINGVCCVGGPRRQVCWEEAGGRRHVQAGAREQG